MDDFFVHMDDAFECMTTSSRFEDVLSHLNYVEFDAFVYCIGKENREEMIKINSVTRKLLYKNNIPFVLIGSEASCDDYYKTTFKEADFTLIRPISYIQVIERLTEFIKKLQDDEQQSVVIDMIKNDRAKKKHVLIVDDSTVMLKTVKRYLEDSYEVATAISGKLALKFLETKTTDLILLDYEMPELDGPAVLEALRSNPVTADIPVVFLTGIAETSKIEKALKMKPQGYLLKPIDNTKLISTIKSLIGE